MSDQADQIHGFDFFHGNWRVEHRRLATRLAGSDDWRTFEATTHCESILGGIGNIEPMSGVFPDGLPFEAMSIRIFDAGTGLWSIWWADNRACTVLPPVAGRFENGIGTFRGQDVCNGVPVDVEFHWTRLDTDSPRWDQAFSADGGATWETNWIMDFTRIA